MSARRAHEPRTLGPPLTHAERALLYAELREIFSREEADIWLRSPHPLLGFRRPINCGFDEVMREIDRLKSGAFG